MDHHRKTRRRPRVRMDICLFFHHYFLLSRRSSSNGGDAISASGRASPLCGGCHRVPPGGYLKLKSSSASPPTEHVHSACPRWPPEDGPLRTWLGGQQRHISESASRANTTTTTPRCRRHDTQLAAGCGFSRDADNLAISEDTPWVAAVATTCLAPLLLLDKSGVIRTVERASLGHS